MPRPLALVTGAATGIGREYAERLAAQGHDLVLVGRRAARLDEGAARIRAKHNVEVETLAADLTDTEQLALVERRLRDSDRLEFLVNNAGFGTVGSFVDTPLDGQDLMHRLHVLATMRLTHAALGPMVARGKGAIVNVSSLAAFAQTSGSVSYCATKAWMNSFTEGLYIELKSMRSPVRVQALCPGFTITEFHETLGMDRGTIPKSLWMLASDVVDASLRGLAQDKAVVIPGWRYRLMNGALSLLPTPLKRAMGIRYGRMVKRDTRRA